jgi:hypothetical protein
MLPGNLNQLANITAQVWSAPAPTGTTSSARSVCIWCWIFPSKYFRMVVITYLDTHLDIIGKISLWSKKERPNPATVARTVATTTLTVKRTTTVVDNQPSLGKKTTTTTVEQ